MFKSQSVSQFHGTVWGLLANDFTPFGTETKTWIVSLQIWSGYLYIFYIGICLQLGWHRGCIA